MPKPLMSPIEQLVLGTFSFYEPMTFSKVVLDMDESTLKNYPNFSKEDLENVIKGLVKKKYLKAVKLDKETGWIRVHIQKKLVEEAIFLVKNSLFSWFFFPST